MCYTITILSLICCTYQLAPSLRTAGDTVRGHSSTGGICFILPDAPQRPVLLAQADRTASPAAQESKPESKDDTSEETGQQEEPPQQKENKPPPKDFVPSEKIDADKAVDFPADI